MSTRVFIAVVLAAVVLVVPATARAKGPNRATLEGPGLAAPVSIDDTSLSTLVDQTGFFSAVFREQPDPMLESAPTDDLGPKLVLAWHVPSGETTADTIRQDIYPYAAGGSLTYIAPGQPFLQTEHTRGGWYRAPASLTTTLMRLGMPSQAELEAAAAGVGAHSAAPAANSSSTSVLPIVVVIVVAAIGSSVIASLAMAARRRRRVVTT